MDTKPCGIYLRASQDRPGDRLAITRHEEAVLAALSHRADLAVEDRYVDNDLTASGRKPRPEFDRLLGDISTGRIRAVAAYAWDRLTRNRRDTLRLLEACQEHRVLIVLVNGSDMDMGQPAGRLTAGILSEVAANELAVLSERRKLRAEQAAHTGTRWPGPRPFGFEADRVTVRPAEAAALAEAYESLLAGVGLAAAARHLNAAGHSSVFGRAWVHTTLRGTLLNPRYAGLRSYRGQIVGPAVWPAVIPESTWRAVHAIITDPARRIAPPAAATLLSAIATCRCGSIVHAGTPSRRGYRVYRCAYRPADAGPHVGARGDTVDAYVGALVVARLSRPDATELLVDDTRPDFDALRERGEVLRGRLEEIAVMLGGGELDRRQAAVASARVRADLAEVDSAMAHAGRAPALAGLIGAEDVGAAWAGLDVDRRRAVVAALFERITLLPAGYGRKPFDPDSVQVTWRA